MVGPSIVQQCSRSRHLTHRTEGDDLTTRKVLKHTILSGITGDPKDRLLVLDVVSHMVQFLGKDHVATLKLPEVAPNAQFHRVHLHHGTLGVHMAQELCNHMGVLVVVDSEDDTLKHCLALSSYLASETATVWLSAHLQSIQH